MKLFCALAAGLLAFTLPALAEGDNMIAVVNVQQIMNESPAAKSVHDQLDSKSKNFQNEITKKQDQLQKEYQELGKQQNVLSKSAFQEKVGAFRKKVTEAQKEMQSKKALLDNASARAGAEIQKAVNEVISDLAKEKGFVAAIPTSELLYADPKLDVTGEV